MLMTLGNMNSEERLAAFLLNLSQRLSMRGYSPTHFLLKMRREEIGSYLGLRLETICRSIAHLRDRGLVEISGRDVEIHNLNFTPLVPLPLLGALERFSIGGLSCRHSRVSCWLPRP